MVQTSKKGSSLGFIVIGVVVAALVIGGAYFIRQQTTPESPKTADNSGTPQPSEKETSKNESKKDSDKSEPQSPTITHQPSVEALPQGGPADSIASLVAAVLLAGAGVSYVRSRRPELSL